MSLCGNSVTMDYRLLCFSFWMVCFRVVRRGGLRALVWFLPIVCTAWCSLASSSAYVGTPSLCHKGTRQSEVSWKTVQLCAFLNSLNSKDWHISGCFSTLIFLHADSSIHSQRGCEGINSLTFLGCIRSRVQTVEVEKGSNETRSPAAFFQLLRCCTSSVERRAMAC